MVEIRTRIKVRRGVVPIATAGCLALPFEKRQKTRHRAALASGEEVAIALPRGEVLRGGDLVVASDGRVFEVVAEPERLLHVECAGPVELARAAYHLGNRHVPVQVGEGFLRLAADHVLEEMLRGLGATVSAVEAPFEPEAGAYSAGHHHAGPGEGPARIHEYGTPENAGHDHEPPHEHGPGCGHSHPPRSR